MACELLGVGFLKIYKWELNESGDKVKNTSSYRIVDVMPSMELKDKIIEPYLFTYNYSQYANTFGYSLSAEEMNHSDVSNSLLSLDNNLSKSDILRFTSSFLPQNSERTATGNSVASSLYYVDEDTSYGNIYLVLLQDEMFVELYSPSSDPTDPYGISEPLNVNLLRTADTSEEGDGSFMVDKEDYVRSLVIGVTQDLSKHKYNDPILKLASQPIKWLVDNEENNYARIPSINSIEREKETVKAVTEGLKIGDRIIVDSTPESLSINPYEVGVNDPITTINEAFDGQ